MSKDDKCTCKACKNTVFHCQICKFVGFLLPSSSWLLKLPIYSPEEVMVDEKIAYLNANMLARTKCKKKETPGEGSDHRHNFLIQMRKK